MLELTKICNKVNAKLIFLTILFIPSSLWLPNLLTGFF